MADPTWIVKRFREAGLRIDEFPGAYERGHGDFGWIWGPFMHHTGSFGETPNGIANHSSLGLASQLHLAANGLYTLCGVGIAWHAGTGSWPGIPTNNGNSCTIGIEAAHNGTAPWSREQYDAYLIGVRTINQALNNPWDKVVAHKEYGAIQGKWDPGGIDMKLFRQRLLMRTEPNKPLPVMNMIDLEAKENPWVGVRKFKPGAEGEWIVGADGKGRMVAYDNAHIYFHPSTGAHAIPHGDPAIVASGIFEAYGRRGYEKGELGFPVRDFAKIETATAKGAVMAFQGGIMYIRDGFKECVVKGVIGQRWALEGYEDGPLGWPITDEMPNGTGGKVQQFEFGTLEWDPSGVVKDLGPAVKDLTLVNTKGIPLAVEAVSLVAA